MQIETIETGSFAMDYFRFGSGDRALVILPGLSVQSVMHLASAVERAYRPLANDFAIYVFDRRKNLPDAYPVYEMARDTAEAIRAVGLRKASLLGASQGGMMAMTIAIEQPDLVEKLVLCSTSARVDEAGDQTIEKWVRLAKGRNTTDLYLAFGEAIYPQSMFEQLRALLIASAKRVTDGDLDRFIILAEGMRGFDVTDNLERISCPVFAVGSKDDRILGAEATMQIAERLNGRRDFSLHMYDGYGHAAYDTAPDFKERVLHFLMQEQTD